ncbi:IclR family transcriptional regulator [Agrococcus carbonis]|uniref:DNA-binding transcriptional regulator, IclR family n=1 Tax=Agrococcus carbonis TaxID=684552 RepID=A0A1H1LRH9_9MICO|nr:helix-turn-helix domain-containing protein [Agrococcus carbonis]SDR77123.1 DNA-binding transcriptional regulator, IclR family [Agrococcus carbonis]
MPTTQGAEAREPVPRPEAAGSQTLSRGLTALALLADHGSQTIQSLADLLGVHRSVAYRLVRTLEEHRLVVRDGGGRLSLGPQLVILARDVEHDLQSAAMPHLQRLADDVGATAFLAVRDGDDAVTLVTAVPRGVNASVAQHPGHRHPIALGAAGIALQALLSEAAWRELGHDGPMHPEVARLRERGFAVSANEVIQGLTSVAAPISARGTTDASVAVVTVGEPDTEALGAAVQRSARAIEADLR